MDIRDLRSVSFFFLLELFLFEVDVVGGWWWFGLLERVRAVDRMDGWMDVCMLYK